MIFLIIPLSDTPIRILPVNKTNFEMLNEFNSLQKFHLNTVESR